jgi:hypothetical protein
MSITCNPPAHQLGRGLSSPSGNTVLRCTPPLCTSLPCIGLPPSSVVGHALASALPCLGCALLCSTAACSGKGGSGHRWPCASHTADSCAPGSPNLHAAAPALSARSSTCAALCSAAHALPHPGRATRARAANRASSALRTALLAPGCLPPHGSRICRTRAHSSVLRHATPPRTCATHSSANRARQARAPTLLLRPLSVHTLLLPLQPSHCFHCAALSSRARTRVPALLASPVLRPPSACTPVRCVPLALARDATSRSTSSRTPPRARHRPASPVSPPPVLLWRRSSSGSPAPEPVPHLLLRAAPPFCAPTHLHLPAHTRLLAPPEPVSEPR